MKVPAPQQWEFMKGRRLNEFGIYYVSTGRVIFASKSTATALAATQAHLLVVHHQN